MTRRTDQVNELLREELASLIQRDLQDPRLHGVISITRVDVSPDLARAHAYVSVLGSDEDRASTLAALTSARSFLRRAIGKRLRIRRAPELDFVSDTSMQRAQELTDLMRRNAEERGEQL